MSGFESAIAAITRSERMDFQQIDYEKNSHSRATVVNERCTAVIHLARNALHRAELFSPTFRNVSSANYRLWNFRNYERRSLPSLRTD